MVAACFFSALLLLSWCFPPPRTLPTSWSEFPSRTPQLPSSSLLLSNLPSHVTYTSWSFPLTVTVPVPSTWNSPTSHLGASFLPVFLFSSSSFFTSLLSSCLVFLAYPFPVFVLPPFLCHPFSLVAPSATVVLCAAASPAMPGPCSQFRMKQISILVRPRSWCQSGWASWSACPAQTRTRPHWPRYPGDFNL